MVDESHLMRDEIPICHSRECKSLSPPNGHHLAICLVPYLRYFGQTLAPRFARTARLFELQSPVKGPLLLILLLTGSQPFIRLHISVLCSSSKVTLHAQLISLIFRCPLYQGLHILRNWHKAHWSSLRSGTERAVGGRHFLFETCGARGRERNKSIEALSFSRFNLAESSSNKHENVWTNHNIGPKKRKFAHVTQKWTIVSKQRHWVKTSDLLE